MNEIKLIYKTPKQVRENEEADGSLCLYGQKTLMESFSKTAR